LKKVLLSLIGWSVFSGICAIIAILAGTFLYLNPSLPDVDTLRHVELQTPLRVFSADNQLIGEFGEKRRDPIHFKDVPQHLVDAILSAEDDGFYSHNGVDITGLLRAASQLVLSGSIKSGGSTITMQVARNFFLSRNQTFSRKFNEILLALKIEQELTKEEILELYLNKIYLGNRSYGVKAAAQVYYGKPLQELTLAQLAMIAGLPKAPSTYNPIVNPSRALIRRDWILRRMHSLKKITTQEYRTASSHPVTASYHTHKLDLHAPYAAEIAREKAFKMLGRQAYTGGYTVKTTIDSRLQTAGQKAVINGLLAYTERHGYRGPERQLDVTDLEELPTFRSATTSINAPENTKVGAVNLLPWIEALKKLPNYGNLHAAAVISVEKQSFTAILASGEAITVHRKNGLDNAGRYVNENYFRPAPKNVERIVAIGDVVRVKAKKVEQNKPQHIAASDDEEQTTPTTEWHFTQVPKIQGALVALNPKNGAIRTIVGGFDFKQSAFNRATQAKRLPGSNFKPFIYSIGIENGLTAATIFNDSPIVIEDNSLEHTWRPENASGKFFGPTRLRKALYLSRNLVSIRLLRTIGVSTVIKGIDRFGVNGQSLPRDLSIALGTHIMTPLEIATGYRITAPLSLIDKNTDNTVENLLSSAKNHTSTQIENATTSNPITTHGPKPAPRVMDQRVTYIMNSILRDVIKRGTAKKAQQLQRQDIGGKTGTTNGPTDAWFSGFNQHLVATAWVGFDNNAKIGKREYGGTAALPIWIDFMKTALDGVPEQLPPRPDGTVTVRIHPETGELTTPENPHGIDEIFLEETVPTEIVDADLDGTNGEKVSPEDIF